MVGKAHLRKFASVLAMGFQPVAMGKPLNGPQVSFVAEVGTSACWRIGLVGATASRQATLGSRSDRRLSDKFHCFMVGKLRGEPIVPICRELLVAWLGIGFGLDDLLGDRQCLAC